LENSKTRMLMDRQLESRQLEDERQRLAQDRPPVEGVALNGVRESQSGEDQSRRDIVKLGSVREEASQFAETRPHIIVQDEATHHTARLDEIVTPSIPSIVGTDTGGYKHDTFDDDVSSDGVRETYDLGPVRIKIEDAHLDPRDAKVVDADIAGKLPKYRCLDFVVLKDVKEFRNVQKLYFELKYAIAREELGLTAVAQDLYEFALACHRKEVKTDPLAHEYVALLAKSLPYYPLQLNLQSTGLIALINLFDGSPFASDIRPLLVESFVTLLAVDNKDLQNDLIAAIATLAKPQDKVYFSTEVVDLLLQKVSDMSDAKLTEWSFQILLLARVMHRKGDQYNLFHDCLSVWTDCPPVLIRASLAIKSFASVAEAQMIRNRETHRIGGRLVTDTDFTKLVKAKLIEDWRAIDLPPALDVTAVNEEHSIYLPPSWMTQDGSDVISIVKIMQLHRDNRSLQGASADALLALARVSQSHAKLVYQKGVASLTDGCVAHPESLTIAIALSHTLRVLSSSNLISRNVEVNKKHITLALDLTLKHHWHCYEVVSAVCNGISSLLLKIGTSQPHQQTMLQEHLLTKRDGLQLMFKSVSSVNSTTHPSDVCFVREAVNALIASLTKQSPSQAPALRPNLIKFGVLDVLLNSFAISIASLKQTDIRMDPFEDTSSLWPHETEFESAARALSRIAFRFESLTVSQLTIPLDTNKNDAAIPLDTNKNSFVMSLLEVVKLLTEQKLFSALVEALHLAANLCFVNINASEFGKAGASQIAFDVLIACVSVNIPTAAQCCRLLGELKRKCDKTTFGRIRKSQIANIIEQALHISANDKRHLMRTLEDDTYGCRLDPVGSFV